MAQAQRQLLMPAHGRELSFGPKVSLCLLGAEAVLAADNEQFLQLVQLFYRDQLTFAQQGCSSAKAVLWLGDAAQVQQAQQRFWPVLTELIEQKQPLNSSEQYQALATAQQLIMSSEQQLRLIQQQNISRVAVSTLEPVFIHQHQGCGLFLELQLSQLAQLNPMLTQAHQTLTVWGIKSNVLQNWLMTAHTGIDRVMPVGQALSFSPDWDGVNLIEQFSRKVQCSF